MSGRAFLNLIEARLLHGLSGDARDLMWQSIHDPAGFVAAQSAGTMDVLLAAGGELG